MAAATDQLKRFLSGIPIFGGLEDATLERIIAMLVEKRWQKGDAVCREGEMGRAMYVVGEGEVVVARAGAAGNMVRMVRLGAGEFFGEMTLIDPQPRSASVIVERESTLYALTCKNLYDLYQSDMPGYTMVLQNLCRELSRRLRRADERICEMVDSRTELDPEVTQIRASPFAKRRHS